MITKVIGGRCSTTNSALSHMRFVHFATSRASKSVVVLALPGGMFRPPRQSALWAAFSLGRLDRGLHFSRHLLDYVSVWIIARIVAIA